MLFGFAVESEVAKLNKTQYALPVSAAVTGKHFLAVKGDWNKAYFNELESFKGEETESNTKKDWVDATSLAFLKLSRSDLATLTALAQWRSKGL